MEIKFISLTYSNGTNAYVKADAIVKMFELHGDTYVYIIDCDSPMIVKESMDEILYDLSNI